VSIILVRLASKSTSKNSDDKNLAGAPPPPPKIKCMNELYFNKEINSGVGEFYPAIELRSWSLQSFCAKVQPQKVLER